MSAVILELGCGSRPMAVSTIRHDFRKHSPHVDVAHDLDVFPWPWEDASIDTIIAIDVFEHLKSDVGDWLDECWRILKPGGSLALQVPRAGCWHATADPTHQRAFHEISFDYWDPRTHWHKTYGKDYRFGEANHWWHVMDRTLRRAASDFGELLDLRFVLKKIESAESPVMF